MLALFVFRVSSVLIFAVAHALSLARCTWQASLHRSAMATGAPGRRFSAHRAARCPACAVRFLTLLYCSHDSRTEKKSKRCMKYIQLFIASPCGASWPDVDLNAQRERLSTNATTLRMTCRRRLAVDRIVSMYHGTVIDHICRHQYAILMDSRLYLHLCGSPQTSVEEEGPREEH